MNGPNRASSNVQQYETTSGGQRHSVFGTIRLRLTVAAIAAMCLSSCEGSNTAASNEPIALTSACELEMGAALDGRLVRFRSKFDLGVEFVRAFDDKCPRIMLFLRSANQGIDLTLCSEEGMRFGCPVSPDFNVEATFTGLFKASGSNGGLVTVTSMTEVRGEGGTK